MDKSLKSVRTKFTLLSISLAIFCSVLGGVGVYTLTKSRLSNQINANKISELTSGDPAVSEYLETQKQYYKHFETIAAAIQRDNSKQITRNLPIIILGAAFISGAVGWILSRKLLVPVKNSFLSQRRFMQDAAHELRNPLAAMKTMIQQARRKPPKDEPLRKFLSSIDVQLQHLSAITTDLLLLERSEYAGSEPTDIAALLNDILEQQHHLIKDKNIRISCEAPEQLVANINPHHFVYIAKNIVENAIKFSDKNTPTIQVLLNKKSDKWVLQVKDNGIGIPNDDVTSVTKRFYRSKNATGLEGTGLGLSIVAKFVDVYKGSLQINSTVGKGTIVTVTI